MKNHKKILWAFIFILLLSQLTYFIDRNRIDNYQEPLLSLKLNVAKAGGSTEYIGLGYQVIKWNVLTEDSTKTGYEINRLGSFNDMNDGPSIELINSN